MNFFRTLKKFEITHLLDVRLHNVSQLAGFAKRDDLKYFLEELCGTQYTHMPILAPEKDLLADYRDKTITWEEYERRFLDLLEKRRVEEELDREMFTGKPVLLCSEHSPEFCHRRLVIEYLDAQWGEVCATHLLNK